MVTRRSLLTTGAAAGAAMLFTPRPSWATSRQPAPPPPQESAPPLLDPAAIQKYVTELFIPPAMPPATSGGTTGIDEYLIGVRQFQQQILPPNLPRTTVWGYGSTLQASTFHYPSFTINARVDCPARVTWINQLVDEQGRFLPHLLPVDPTLHWANPPGGVTGCDAKPQFATTPGLYRGPVPIVTHLHGGLNDEESDGYPEAWYLPAANNIPAEFATVGSFYAEFRDEFAANHEITWEPGTATFQYANVQRATAEWFHDHCLGLTRLSLYAGPVGFYILRGGSSDLPPGMLPGPAPAVGDPPGIRYHEIPLIIQDRSFNADGSLFYPDSRTFAGYHGPYVPTTDVSPIWNPEFFADTIVVNGNTWPVLNVEQRRYRFRFLNGCNSRFLILKVAAQGDEPRPAKAALPIWQIGSDGGFLPEPVRLEQVLIGNGQRVDAIVDFTDVAVGTELFLVNEGREAAPHGGTPTGPPPPADPATTGQVMKFVVVPRVGTDTSVPPDQLNLPTFTPVGPAANTRRLCLSEQASTVPGAGPVAALLGTVSAHGAPEPLHWEHPSTENPTAGSVEIWELHNQTTNPHPIHVHGVQFQLVGRGPGGQRPPSPDERGFLDTVISTPGEIVRIKIPFDQVGRFVWHCNMLEHEDNEMMRPYQVIPKGGPDTGDGGSRGPDVALAAAGAAVLSAAAVAGTVLARRGQEPQSAIQDQPPPAQP
jgi:spore coat protein A